MTFAKAFQNQKKELNDKLGISISQQPPKEENIRPTNPSDVPRMYRAQVEGRCSLQYANNQQDLNQWTQEWVQPNPTNHQPTYQYLEENLSQPEFPSTNYSLIIDNFNWRVFSNCGQDSIARPVIGKNGIPMIPGSSIKGLFKRLRNNPDISQENKNKIESYCGSGKSNGKLRFHGAYPLGDWASTIRKNTYRIVDICHPQQEKQVEKQTGTSAYALISLYKPKLLFKLSSIKPLSEEEWKNIEKLLRRALKQGLGGKTSSGYGLYAKPQDNYSIQVTLEGTGVSSQLLGKESEFRPNLFKATLRGHAKRLLGGFTNDSRLINQKLDYLFGGSKNTGVVQIYWQPDSYPEFFTVGTEKTPSYEIKGKLYLDVNRSNNNHYAQDLEFIRKVLEFSLIMAGLGKSWRRIWHQDFKPDYKTRGIGCHWIYNFTQPKLNLTNINNREKLQSFLRDLLKISQKYISSSSREKSTSQWREAWHPNNVKVYCKVVTRSELINLFHDKTFKSIPAVGGKISITVREGGREKTKDKLQVSHVWHRMLPLDNNKYLEIITLFGKNQDPAWKNSKPTFEQEITGRGFDLINLNPPYN